MAFSTHDIVPDSPTNNFATLNPLAPDINNNFSMSEGNLRLYTVESFSGDGRNISTIPFLPAMGKIYIESAKHIDAFAFGFSQGNNAFGIYGTTNQNFEILAGTNNGGNITFQYRSNNEDFPFLNTSTTEVIGVLIDFTNSQFKIKLASTDYTYSFSHNSWINFSNTQNIVLACSNGGNDGYGNFNFGQDPTFAGYITLTGNAGTYTDANGIGAFYYDPIAIDSEALALCTANLPDFTPNVADDTPQDYFKTVIWSGTTYANATVPVGFTPDFVWAKAENANSNHRLVDSVRGGNGSLMYELASNDAGGNGTDSAITGLSNNGINLSSGNFGAVSGQDIVAWCFRAGGNSNTFNINGTGYSTYSALQTANTSLPASSTSGMIVPSGMSINTDAGFSIVKWQASNGSDKTIPHGLSNSLDMIVMKNLDAGTYSWHVSHVGLTTNHNVLLNDTGESFNAATGGWVEIGTGGVFNIKNGTIGTNTNNGTDNYIAYCWHSVAGYSKFGSYTGNGSADGPMVYCGFRPAWVMCKCISDATTTHTSWAIYDNARDSINVMNKVLYANKSINEGYRGNGSTAATDIYIDFLSNGFKVRSIKEEINDDDETYIFMAFAEQPFKFSNAR